MEMICIYLNASSHCFSVVILFCLLKIYNTRLHTSTCDKHVCELAYAPTLQIPPENRD
jgi:hypothetical protein